MMSSTSKPPIQALASKLLALQESVECVLCRGRLKRPVATICGHTFCGVCVDKTFEAAAGEKGGRGRAACPLCMTPLHKRSIRETQRTRSIIEAVQRIVDVAKLTIKASYPSAFSADACVMTTASLTRATSDDDTESEARGRVKPKTAPSKQKSRAKQTSGPTRNLNPGSHSRNSVVPYIKAVVPGPPEIQLVESSSEDAFRAFEDGESPDPRHRQNEKENRSKSDNITPDNEDESPIFVSSRRESTCQKRRIEDVDEAIDNLNMASARKRNRAESLTKSIVPLDNIGSRIDRGWLRAVKGRGEGEVTAQRRNDGKSTRLDPWPRSRDNDVDEASISEISSGENPHEKSKKKTSRSPMQTKDRRLVPLQQRPMQQRELLDEYAFISSCSQSSPEASRIKKKITGKKLQLRRLQPNSQQHPQNNPPPPRLLQRRRGDVAGLFQTVQKIKEAYIEKARAKREMRRTKIVSVDAVGVKGRPGESVAEYSRQSVSLIKREQLPREVFSDSAEQIATTTEEEGDEENANGSKRNESKNRSNKSQDEDGKGTNWEEVFRKRKAHQVGPPDIQGVSASIQFGSAAVPSRDNQRDTATSKSNYTIGPSTSTGIRRTLPGTITLQPTYSRSTRSSRRCWDSDSDSASIHSVPSVHNLEDRYEEDLLLSPSQPQWLKNKTKVSNDTDRTSGRDGIERVGDGNQDGRGTSEEDLPSFDSRVEGPTQPYSVPETPITSTVEIITARIGTTNATLPSLSSKANQLPKSAPVNSSPRPCSSAAAPRGVDVTPSKAAAPSCLLTEPVTPVRNMPPLTPTSSTSKSFKSCLRMTPGSGVSKEVRFRPTVDASERTPLTSFTNRNTTSSDDRNVKSAPLPSTTTTSESDSDFVLPTPAGESALMKMKAKMREGGMRKIRKLSRNRRTDETSIIDEQVTVDELRSAVAAVTSPIRPSIGTVVTSMEEQVDDALTAKADQLVSDLQNPNSEARKVGNKLTEDANIHSDLPNISVSTVPETPQPVEDAQNTTTSGPINASPTAVPDLTEDPPLTMIVNEGDDFECEYLTNRLHIEENNISHEKEEDGAKMTNDVLDKGGNHEELTVKSDDQPTESSPHDSKAALVENLRQAEEMKQEEKRLAKEMKQKKVDKQKNERKQVEERRREEEKKQKEERRRAEKEKRLEEENRLAKKMKQENERKQVEEKRREEEKREAEEKNQKEERRRAENEEEKRLEEEDRLAKERNQEEENRHAEEKSREEKKKKAEETKQEERKQAEKEKVEEEQEKRREEEMLWEEESRREEEKREAEEKKKEERRRAEKKKRREEEKRQEEEKIEADHSDVRETGAKAEDMARPAGQSARISTSQEVFTPLSLEDLNAADRGNEANVSDREKAKSSTELVETKGTENNGENKIHKKSGENEPQMDEELGEFTPLENIEQFARLDGRNESKGLVGTHVNTAVTDDMVRGGNDGDAKNHASKDQRVTTDMSSKNAVENEAETMDTMDFIANLHFTPSSRKCFAIDVLNPSSGSSSNQSQVAKAQSEKAKNVSSGLSNSKSKPRGSVVAFTNNGVEEFDLCENSSFQETIRQMDGGDSSKKITSHQSAKQEFEEKNVDCTGRSVIKMRDEPKDTLDEFELCSAEVEEMFRPFESNSDNAPNAPKSLDNPNAHEAPSSTKAGPSKPLQDLSIAEFDAMEDPFSQFPSGMELCSNKTRTSKAIEDDSDWEDCSFDAFWQKLSQKETTSKTTQKEATSKSTNATTALREPEVQIVVSANNQKQGESKGTKDVRKESGESKGAKDSALDPGSFGPTDPFEDDLLETKDGVSKTIAPFYPHAGETSESKKDALPKPSVPADPFEEDADDEFFLPASLKRLREKQEIKRGVDDCEDSAITKENEPTDLEKSRGSDLPLAEDTEDSDEEEEDILPSSLDPNESTERLKRRIIGSSKSLKGKTSKSSPVSHPVCSSVVESPLQNQFELCSNSSFQRKYQPCSNVSSKAALSPQGESPGTFEICSNLTAAKQPSPAPSMKSLPSPATPVTNLRGSRFELCSNASKTPMLPLVTQINEFQLCSNVTVAKQPSAAPSPALKSMPSPATPLTNLRGSRFELCINASKTAMSPLVTQNNDFQLCSNVTKAGKSPGETSVNNYDDIFAHSSESSCLLQEGQRIDEWSQEVKASQTRQTNTLNMQPDIFSPFSLENVDFEESSMADRVKRGRRSASNVNLSQSPSQRRQTKEKSPRNDDPSDNPTSLRNPVMSTSMFLKPSPMIEGKKALKINKEAESKNEERTRDKKERQEEEKRRAEQMRPKEEEKREEKQVEEKRRAEEKRQEEEKRQAKETKQEEKRRNEDTREAEEKKQKEVEKRGEEKRQAEKEMKQKEEEMKQKEDEREERRQEKERQRAENAEKAIEKANDEVFEFVNLCSDDSGNNAKRVSSQDLTFSQREERIERNIRKDEQRQKDYEENVKKRRPLIKKEVFSAEYEDGAASGGGGGNETVEEEMSKSLPSSTKDSASKSRCPMPNAPGPTVKPAPSTALPSTSRYVLYSEDDDDDDDDDESLEYTSAKLKEIQEEMAEIRRRLAMDSFPEDAGTAEEKDQKDCKEERKRHSGEPKDVELPEAPPKLTPVAASSTPKRLTRSSRSMTPSSSRSLKSPKCSKSAKIPDSPSTSPSRKSPASSKTALSPTRRPSSRKSPAESKVAQSPPRRPMMTAFEFLTPKSKSKLPLNRSENNDLIDASSSSPAMVDELINELQGTENTGKKATSPSRETTGTNSQPSTPTNHRSASAVTPSRPPRSSTLSPSPPKPLSTPEMKEWRERSMEEDSDLGFSLVKCRSLLSSIQGVKRNILKGDDFDADVSPHRVDEVVASGSKSKMEKASTQRHSTASRKALPLFSISPVTPRRPKGSDEDEDDSLIVPDTPEHDNDVSVNLTNARGSRRSPALSTSGMKKNREQKCMDRSPFDSSGKLKIDQKDARRRLVDTPPSASLSRRDAKRLFTDTPPSASSIRPLTSRQPKSSAGRSKARKSLQLAQLAEEEEEPILIDDGSLDLMSKRANNMNRKKMNISDDFVYDDDDDFIEQDVVTSSQREKVGNQKGKTSKNNRICHLRFVKSCPLHPHPPPPSSHPVHIQMDLVHNLENYYSIYTRKG